MSRSTEGGVPNRNAVRLGSPYEIARSSGRCAATGEPLTPGETCIATLCEREFDDGFDRLDFSLAAWEAGARPERLWSFWRTSVPDPHVKKQVFLDDDLLLNLFERLEDDPRPQRVAFRFVIALVLMRKKLMRYMGREEREGVQIWFLLPKGATPDSARIVITNPRLADADLEAITEQLSEILHGDLS